MMRSLYAGISGLRNFQTKLDIIGNNIANVNTVAFKGSRITFAETMAQTLSGEIAPSEGQGGINSVQVGLGMRTIGIDTNFNQGALESTGVNTDLAIQGDGFFMVTDGNNQFYTRAGAFQLDALGNLVMSGSGQKVLGYTANQGADGVDASTARTIQIPLGSRSEAKSTTDVTLNGNLDMNETSSIARLLDAGETGITNLTGTARNGVGGTHRLAITGENATQSLSFGLTQGLVLTDAMDTHGVTTVDGMTVVVDGERAIRISGLTATSTISDLINAINSQVDGVTAKLNEEGAIQIARDFYGDGGVYNVELRDSAVAGEVVAGGVVSSLLDPGSSFAVNNGTGSTLVAIDNFTSNQSSTVAPEVLAIDFDERTGLATGIKDLGDGGVFINAAGGLKAGNAVVETADTTHSTSILVYDSMGNTHNMTMTYTRTGTPNTWDWSIDVPEPAVIVEGGTGSVAFKSDGSLESFQYNGGVTGLVFNPGNDAQNINLSFDAGSFGSFEGLTQSSAPTTALASQQDGYGMGTLQGIFFDDAGNIFGNFSNGVTDVLAQVLMANFTNPQGLERVGENLYRQTTNSGVARVSNAEQAGAKINSGFLEGSNVDLSREFTDMIIAQRAFQASARVITTSDALLEEVTRLKG